MPLAKPTKPDAITAVPTPVPLRTDRANFAARGDAMMGWFPTGIAGVNTTLTYFGNAVNFVEQEANEAEASATAAAASNVAAGANAAAAAASAGATVWVTGTTYAAGVVRYSPTNFQTYRDTVGGLSNTDPASDTSGRWISAMLPSVEAIELPAMPPTAVFNFASGVIDRRFVESRSTAGTRYNIFGNLETIAAGVAKPTYNPATNACEGYLASPATTYLAMRSSEIDNASYWGSSNATFTPNAHIGADGTLSAFKIEATATAVTAIVRVLTATATTQYFTVRAKKGSGATDFNIFGAYNITTGSNINFCSIDYDTGVITESFGSGATAREVANGYWEIKIPITVAIGNSFQVYLCTSSGVETAGKFAYIDTPTVSDQPNATPYPTVGSNVTRTAGGLLLDLVSHTEIINPRGFTFVVVFDGSSVSAAASERMIINLAGAGGNEQIRINISLGIVYADAVTGGLVVASFNLGAMSSGRNVVAFSVAENNFSAVARGSVLASDTSGGMPAVTSLGVGRYPPATGYEPNAAISLLATFPRACSAGELQAFVNNF